MGASLANFLSSKRLRRKSNKMWRLAYIKFDLPSEGLECENIEGHLEPYLGVILSQNIIKYYNFSRNLINHRRG